MATGAYTSLMSKDLGCLIPIQPGKGYSMTTNHPGNYSLIPLLFSEHKVAMTPMQSCYRLGSMMEFSGFDTTVCPKRIKLLELGASHYLEEPMGNSIQEQWCGLRPMTYDGVPIIDQSLLLSNVYVVAGHNMMGMSMAPGTGKLMAELVSGNMPHISPVPYSLRRF